MRRALFDRQERGVRILLLLTLLEYSIHVAEHPNIEHSNFEQRGVASRKTDEDGEEILPSLTHLH